MTDNLTFTYVAGSVFLCAYSNKKEIKLLSTIFASTLESKFLLTFNDNNHYKINVYFYNVTL
jgi:hypothetical protein